MVRWVVGSTPHGGLVELSMSRSSQCPMAGGICHSVCGIVHIKDNLLLIEKRVVLEVAAGFISHYRNGP